MVTVGFKPDYLEVIETVELVTLTAVLLAGALERDLIVIVTTNFSSIGECYGVLVCYIYDLLHCV